MLTMIAALYVIIPALLALACVALAYCCPVVIAEEASSEQAEAVYQVTLQARNEAASDAIDALQIWYETGIDMWRKQAIMCYHEALRLHYILQDVGYPARC